MLYKMHGCIFYLMIVSLLSLLSVSIALFYFFLHICAVYGQLVLVVSYIEKYLNPFKE